MTRRMSCICNHLFWSINWDDVSYLRNFNSLRFSSFNQFDEKLRKKPVSWHAGGLNMWHNRYSESLHVSPGKSRNMPYKSMCCLTRIGLAKSSAFLATDQRSFAHCMTRTGNQRDIQTNNNLARGHELWSCSQRLSCGFWLSLFYNIHNARCYLREGHINTCLLKHRYCDKDILRDTEDSWDA